jgi:hypothetical protein
MTPTHPTSVFAPRQDRICVLTAGILFLKKYISVIFLKVPSFGFSQQKQISKTNCSADLKKSIKKIYNVS